MNRNLILVSLSLVTWGIGEGMFLYFQPLYLEELGASAVEIGALLGIVGLTMTLSYLPAGYLSDVFGRRLMLRSAWIAGVFATGIMALANSLPVFIVGMALYGLTSFVVVPLNSYITHARGHLSIGRTITIISASYNFGVILGPIMGGLIGDSYGLKHTFQLAALFFILSTLLILTIQDQPVSKEATRKSLPIKSTLSNKNFVKYLILIFLVLITLYLPQPLSQNYLQNERGLSLTEIGRLIAIRSFGIVVLNLLLGQLRTQLGFLLSQVCVAIFAMLLWRGQSMPWYVLGYFMLGGYHTARSLAVAQGSEMIKKEFLGVGYGFIETAMSSAIILAPPIAGYLYSIQPTLMYAVSTVLISLSIFASILLIPRYFGGQVLESKTPP